MRSDKALDVAVEIKVSLDHGSRTALYQQIVDRIWLDVIEGTLEPGQRLPTVRQLAVSLEVHLDTVSRAYGQLERLGVVHGRHEACALGGVAQPSLTANASIPSKSLAFRVHSVASHEMAHAAIARSISRPRARPTTR